MIYEYLLGVISEATGGSTKQLAGTLLVDQKTMGDYIWKLCFCKALAVSLVWPYIILTVWSSDAVVDVFTERFLLSHIQKDVTSQQCS